MNSEWAPEDRARLLHGEWNASWTVTHLGNARRRVVMTPRRWRLLRAIQRARPCLCCFGIGVGRRCARPARWVSTYHGKPCRGTQGWLGWCWEHMPADPPTQKHGLMPIEEVGPLPL